MVKRPKCDKRLFEIRAASFPRCFLLPQPMSRTFTILTEDRIPKMKVWNDSENGESRECCAVMNCGMNRCMSKDLETTLIYENSNQ